MSLRLVLLRIKRRSSSVLVLGTCVCILVMIMLTFCHVPCEHDRIGNSMESDSLKKEILIRTNLLIVIMSAATHYDVRNTIRESWAQHLPNGAVIRFVVGKKNLVHESLENLNQELKIHRDLLMLNDIEESYSVLTKKLLSTLKWVDQHVKYNFLLKIDEDSFIHVENILNELLSKPQSRLYWGFFDGRAHVKRLGKWTEKEFVLCDRYLPYALGGGYVISKDLVSYIARNADMLKIYNSEDVSMGTWLSGLDIHRVHDVRFDTEYKSRGCYNSYLITHKKSQQDLMQLQHNLKTLNRLCDKEYRVRLSYEYNWDVVPSQCCERTDPNLP